MLKDIERPVDSWIGDPSLGMAHRVKIVSAEMLFFWGLAFDITARWTPWDWEIRDRSGKLIGIANFQYNYDDTGPRDLSEGQGDLALNMIRYAGKNNLVPLWIWRTPKNIYFKVLGAGRMPFMVSGTNRPEGLKP